MLKKRSSGTMGRSSLGWLDSRFHFSFADYYHPGRQNYSVLRVLNDDFIQPGTGFELHPHKNMEIITYVVEGELTHEDSMKNRRTLERGEVQYMSAGTGILHSEHNLGSKPLRMLQIWLLPDRLGHSPQYGDFRFPWEERIDEWLPIVSGLEGSAPIRIHQDATLYVTALSKGKRLSFTQKANRQYYLVQIEGTSSINGISLEEKDALEISNENIEAAAGTNGHLLLFELPRQKVK